MTGKLLFGRKSEGRNGYRDCDKERIAAKKKGTELSCFLASKRKSEQVLETKKTLLLVPL